MAGPGISLQNLKGKFHLTDSQLNEEVSDTYLTDASKIIADHEILGPELGLASEEMTAISLERTMDVQRLTMLRKWKQKFAWKANYRTLIEAHLKCHRADRARDLCKLLADSDQVGNLDEQVETLKTKLMKENLLRQEMELLLELKRLNRRQPTPPTGDYYVESRGIKYNIMRHCVAGNTYEVMILVSVGSEFPAGLQVQHRVKDPTLAKEAIQTYGRLPIVVPGLHEEAAADLMAIASKRLQDYSGDLVRLCQDVPGKQSSKTYYLKVIEEHIKQCQQPMVVLHYMGHSEEGTGNWCFKDGTISFQEIFDLYKRHCLGKPLIIHSDCCYSGNWTKECAKTLDSLNIPACGHMAREHGILIKVYASCEPDQKAFEPEYSVEGLMAEENGTVTVCTTQLSHQKPSAIDTTRLVCCRGPDDLCRSKKVLRNWTWQKVMKDPLVIY